jgi:hypothetical protein
MFLAQVITVAGLCRYSLFPLYFNQEIYAQKKNKINKKEKIQGMKRIL